MRRLPIYFLIDVSESMVGEPIAAVENGIQLLLSALRQNPYALETAHISVITFGTSAKQIMPLTELFQFQMPTLVLGSGTALGQGLELLEKRIAAEVQKTTTEKKGDYKPLAFLLTDGEPTDSWQSVAGRFIKNRHIQLIAMGFGQDVNLNTLRCITENVLLGEKANRDTLTQFFKWVSASIATASQAIDQTGKDSKISLEKLSISDDIVVVDDNTPQQKIELNRFVFLHNKCVKTKKFYLQKFAKNGRAYTGSGAFSMDTFEELSKGGGVTINCTLLRNNDPCPYCGNTSWAMCNCGKTFCSPPLGGTLTCPWCGKTDYYSPRTFSVGGGAG
jgi:uncharacterized protein YegL